MASGKKNIALSYACINWTGDDLIESLQELQPVWFPVSKLSLKVCFQTEILGNLFKYIFLGVFFCLLLHRLAVRISLPFHIFLGEPRMYQPKNQFKIFLLWSTRKLKVWIIWIVVYREVPNTYFSFAFVTQYYFTNSNFFLNFELLKLYACATACLKSGVIAKIYAGELKFFRLHWPTPRWERLSFERDENTRRKIRIKPFKNSLVRPLSVIFELRESTGQHRQLNKSCQ